MRALVCTIALFVTAACEKPAPPTLVPERVRITALSPSRIDLDVRLSVTNPNAVDLVARSLDAHVVIGGKFDVGTVEIPVTTVLPARKTTTLDVPLSVRVADVAPLAELALTHTDIPYTVDGHVELGGELLHVTVPYQLSDSVPRDQIVRAALAAIPGLSGSR